MKLTRVKWRALFRWDSAGSQAKIYSCYLCDFNLHSESVWLSPSSDGWDDMKEHALIHGIEVTL